MNPPSGPEATLRRMAILLGAFSFAVVLAAHNITDGDLWGKLAIGAHVWKYGTVPMHDVFAFTPVLPAYIEHEWGAGAVFFGVLKFFGPAGLMVLKIGLAFGAVLAALAVGRKTGCAWETLLVLAIPASACVLLGYIPVLRSHAFTYCFFGVMLLGLEEIRAGEKWPILAMPPLMLVWSNMHGGFVAGLGAIAVYTGFALLTRRQVKAMLLVVSACAAATLVNVYGLKFWAYLVPALLNPRPHIAEWQPLPFFKNDVFLSFRMLFVLVVILLAAGWRRVEKKNWPGLVLLAITARAGLAQPAARAVFRSGGTGVCRPVFGGGARRFQASGCQGVCGRPSTGLCGHDALWRPRHFRRREFPAPASFEVLAPVGHDPVREVDILSRAQAEGNLATPFGWGCYCAWRLYPRIKISMDGRYETTYPESTFELNNAFYEKRGPDWDRLIRDYPVDYVILEFTEERLRPPDLTDRGYVLIWQTEGHSALLALPQHAEQLRRAAAGLPPTTIDPLDAKIPDAWWPR